MEAIARDVATAVSVVELAAAGDRVAFARIVAAYHADMVRVAYVVSGGDQDAADDAVQEAWEIAWQKLRSLRDPERIRAWLISVAANEARRAGRRRRRWGRVEVDVAEIDVPGGDSPDRDAALDLERVLRRLSPDERALLALRYEAGLDSAEIGALSGRAAGTVRWRLSQLTARLRKDLSDG